MHASLFHNCISPIFQPCSFKAPDFPAKPFLTAQEWILFCLWHVRSPKIWSWWQYVLLTSLPRGRISSPRPVRLTSECKVDAIQRILTCNYLSIYGYLYSILKWGSRCFLSGDWREPSHHHSARGVSWVKNISATRAGSMKVWTTFLCDVLLSFSLLKPDFECAMSLA